MRTSVYRYECSKCGQLFLVVETDNPLTEKCLPQEMRPYMVKEEGKKKMCAHCWAGGHLIGREDEILALKIMGHTDEEIQTTRGLWAFLDRMRASETAREHNEATIAKESAPCRQS